MYRDQKPWAVSVATLILVVETAVNIWLLVHAGRTSES